MKEVWEKQARNIKIHNPAFEKINPSLVTGIISELGIFPHQLFIEEVKTSYPWMF